MRSRWTTRASSREDSGDRLRTRLSRAALKRLYKRLRAIKQGLALAPIDAEELEMAYAPESTWPR